MSDGMCAGQPASLCRFGDGSLHGRFVKVKSRRRSAPRVTTVARCWKDERPRPFRRRIQILSIEREGQHGSPASLTKIVGVLPLARHPPSDLDNRAATADGNTPSEEEFFAQARPVKLQISGRSNRPADARLCRFDEGLKTGSWKLAAGNWQLLL